MQDTSAISAAISRPTKKGNPEEFLRAIPVSSISATETIYSKYRKPPPVMSVNSKMSKSVISIQIPKAAKGVMNAK